MTCGIGTVAAFVLYAALAVITTQAATYTRSMSVLVKLNSSYQTPAVMSATDKLVLWLLTRQTSGQQLSPSTLAIYDPTSLPRNTSVAAKYRCLPAEAQCGQLSIERFGPTDTGVYALQYRSSDYLNNYYYQLNVSVYAAGLQFACANGSGACAYDAQSNNAQRACRRESAALLPRARRPE